MPSDNKAIVRRFYDEVVNQGKIELIDELVTPDFIEHEGFPGLPPSREGVKQFFSIIRGAFPDLQMEVHDVIGEGDRVAVRATMRGTHKGEFMGVAPTGRQVAVQVMDMVRFAGGKAAEHWGATDNVALMEQLGAMPQT